MGTWDDDGPVSQGKVLTAVLQGREDDAAAMLAGWSLADLQALATAAGRLGVLAATASHPRRPKEQG